MSAEELHRQQMGGLGDLTEPIKTERGEFVNRRPAIPPRGEMPGDMAQNFRGNRIPLPSLTQQINATSDAPRIKPGVMPIYDTLPANGARVIYSDLVGILDSPPAPDITGIFANRVILSQRIPDGRVFLARELRVNVLQVYEDDASGTQLGVPTELITLSVGVNGSVDIANQNIRLDPLDGYNPISVIAGPRDVVEVFFSVDYAALSGGDLNLFLQILVNLRGDLLLPTDAPTQYTGLSK